MSDNKLFTSICAAVGAGAGAIFASQLGSWKRESKLVKKYKKCQDIRKSLEGNSEREQALAKIGCSDSQLLSLLRK